MQSRAGTEAELVIENGEPLQVIARLVGQTGADLLLAGHWAPSERWRRGAVGHDDSDALRIVHHASVPVLMFKDGLARQEQKPFTSARQRLVRDLVIALPFVIIFVIMVMLALAKNGRI